MGLQTFYRLLAAYKDLLQTTESCKHGAIRLDPVVKDLEKTSFGFSLFATGIPASYDSIIMRLKFTIKHLEELTAKAEALKVKE